jgi:hypothetical protein
MIFHAMGDAIPPPNKNLRTLEWASKKPGEPPTSKTVILTPGMAVSENLRDDFWCAVKMHKAFSAACTANNVTLPDRFIIEIGGELVGAGSYRSNDAHDRAFSDCVVREAERDLRGCREWPLIGMDLSSIPPDEQIDIARRTGAPVVAIGDRQ